MQSVWWFSEAKDVYQQGLHHKLSAFFKQKRERGAITKFLGTAMSKQNINNQG